MKLYASFSHRVLGLIISILFLTSFTFAASGDVDTSFLASTSGNTNGNINVVKVQPDGKMLVGGFFTEANGVARGGLFRLNADTSFDTSFNPPDFFGGFGVGGTVDAIALQTDGKILVGGRINGINTTYNPGVYRLNPDGTVDSSFNIEQLGQGGSISDIEVLPNNQFIIVGQFSFNDFFGSRNIFRLNANGTRDNTFAQPLTVQFIADFQILPNGKMLIARGSSVIRLNADGAVDTTFTSLNANNSINAIKVLPDNSFLIGGSFTTVNSFLQSRLTKATPDGLLDLNFNLNNPGANSVIYDIETRQNGKIVIAGGFNAYNSVTRINIAQLNSDGSLDNSFVYNSIFFETFNEITILPNEQILVGTITSFNLPSLLKLNIDGSTDTSYSLPAKRIGQVYKVLQQPDGKVLFCGDFRFANNIQRNSLTRVNSDGTLDTTFVPYFNTSARRAINAIGIQPDGKILVGLNDGLRRLNADGSQDSSFFSNLWVREIVVLTTGKILYSGITSGIGRLNSDGTMDNTFIGAGTINDVINKLFVQSDGKILIGGAFTQVGAAIRGRIARLNADGTIDNTFNPPGGANNTIYDLDVQSDGKIVLAGQFTGLNGSTTRQNIGRLNADGTLDTTFAQTTNAALLAVKVQSSGKILIGGSMSVVGSTLRNGLARLNADGSVDSTFNAFANSTVWDINQQTDGKILTVGEFTRINGTSTVRIARLQDNSVSVRPLFDFDGDGKADVSVYRASTNTWYRILSGNSTLLQNNFGIANDIPVPADFDGDGKTDLAIFRPSTGTFWYQSSINNAQIANQWGQSGDIPRPSDFDGDGKTDFIIFRPSENNWYRLGSTGQVSTKGFGAVGDKPVIGDFDGDGKSDVAIFRPSTGDWWYQSSINNAQLATHFGASTDVPSPADFDGDGKTDFAVFRPSTGVWYVLNSSTGAATIVQFGISEDKPVPADYDGDGKADIAVFRPSTGLWYLLRSTSGFSALQFGISSDVPLPNSFVQ
jgi:uncharacterized delta-60 repeat protein